jgi:glycosyltransferase involved in cell wall biosynthesis
MKVLHIVSGSLKSNPLKGGAAKGAYWLHLGLKKLGVNSKILTNGYLKDKKEDVETITKNKKDIFMYLFRNNLDKLLLLPYINREKRIFDTGFFGYDITKTNIYQESDIINLHWINNGFVNIKQLSKINKPIIWTVRDMWPMTGGCHYSMGCDHFESGCGKCKQLNSNRDFDLSKIVLKRKEKYLPQNIKIVGISNWVSSLARKSKLFRNREIKTIFNNVKTDDFIAVDKAQARKILNIKTNKKLINWIKSFIYSILWPLDKNSISSLVILEQLTPLADKITVSNSFLKSKYGGEIIVHGRSRKKFDPKKSRKQDLRKKYNVKSNKIIVTFLGTPRPYKGLEDLIDAIVYLNNQNVILQIIGLDSSDYSTKIKRIAKKNISQDNLKLLNKIPFNKVPEFLKLSDIVVIPQRKSMATKGQLPAKIFDAMAMSIPIIATDVGDLSKILGGTGWIVKPEDHIEISNAINDIIKNPSKANKLSKKARERFLKKYSWEVLESKICHILSEIYA